MNYVANDAKTRSCPNGAVANMSLGGSKSTAVNSAAANVVTAGVFLAVAAGNEATDAANSSPASEPTVYTVGATDSTDKLASFSNYGTIVDILAPGVSILSTWLNGGTVSSEYINISFNSQTDTRVEHHLWNLHGHSPCYWSRCLHFGFRGQEDPRCSFFPPHHSFHQEQDHWSAQQHQELPCFQRQPQRLDH